MLTKKQKEETSNRARIEKYNIPSKSIKYAYEILNGNFEIAQKLIDSLNMWYDINDVPVYLLEELAPKITPTKYGYGRYTIVFVNGEKEHIEIAMYLFDGEGEELEPYVFLITLVHEWVHHWDCECLNICEELHTVGFAKRIKQILDLLEIEA